MKITAEQVAKVVPQRIFSIAVHPTEGKVLAFAGDKWGRVGLWDVVSKILYLSSVYNVGCFAHGIQSCQI